MRAASNAIANNNMKDLQAALKRMDNKDYIPIYNFFWH